MMTKLFAVWACSSSLFIPVFGQAAGDYQDDDCGDGDACGDGASRFDFMQVRQTVQQVSLEKAGGPRDTECDDLLQGEPDWHDGELHLDDFEELVAKCHAQKRFGIDPHDLWFVHVGKCAGSSVYAMLNYCPNHVHQIHTTPAANCMPSIPVKWVVSVRDPLARAISAFNWRSPLNGHVKGHFSEHETQLYKCFNSVNEFAEALEDEDKCGSYARRAMDSPMKGEHLGKGFAYYFKENFECILEQEIYLVRSENFMDDAKNVAKLLGATGFPDEPHVNGAYPMKNDTYVSAKGKRLLMKNLKEDYEVLRKLEVAARNGKPGTY